MGRLTASKSGEIASFKTPYATNIKSLKVHFSPKQEGSGDPSPENIREIVGWDGVEGYCGYEYLSNTQITINKTINSSGKIITENGMAVTDFIPVKENEVFTLKFISTYAARTRRIYGYDLNQESVNSLASISWATVGNEQSLIATIPSGVSYIRVSYYNNDLKKRLTKDGITSLSIKWKRLPDEYQEVEYIESDGNQYIELPFGFNNTDEVIIKASEQSLKRDKFLIAPKTWDTTSRFAMVGGGYNNLFGVEYGSMATTGAGTNFTSSTRDINIHTWKYKDYNFSITDLDVSPLDVSGISFSKETSNLKLFFGYASNSIGKIAYYYHKKIDGTICELIPCYRKSDNEIGMYDLVSNTFYTNQGTGSFTKGNDVEYAKDIYGGTVDLITGELVQTYAKTIIDGSVNFSMNNYGTYNRFVKYYNDLGFLNPIASQLPKADWLKGNSSPNGVYIGSTKNVLLYLNSDLGIDSPTALSEYLQEHPLEVVYKLETPITYQLSPQQLQAFAGQNNFWSNADSIEVSYELIDTPDIQRAKKRIILNQPHIETVEGDIVSFNTDMRAPLKECKVNFLPIQEGSGDPSPSNIRSIIGWTGINLYKCSRNLVTQDLLINGYYVRGRVTSAGTVIGSIASASAWSCTDFIKVKPSTIYTIFYSWTNASAAGLAYYSDAHIDSAISGISMEQMKNSPYTFTTPFNCHYLRFTSRYQNAFMALVKGEATTIDEIYNGTTIPLDWTDEAGTVYGGYVDLVNGELVATYAILENKWNEYKNNYEMTNVNRRSFLFPYLKYNTGAATDVKCNIAIAQHSLADIVHFYLAKENNNVYMFLPKDLDEETVIQVVAKIAEPIHYSLTPQQILTLKQTNNIYANTNGNIEVKYWKH